MKSVLHIHLLGDFLLLADDTPITSVSVPRLQSLLAYLLLHRTAPQDRSHLAFLLWPDSTEAQAHTNLRKALHQLRQVLPDIDQLLQADKRSLWWQPTPDTSWTVDVRTFEQALTMAQQAEQAKNTTAERHALEEAIHLYRGELLPTCYDEWILPERDRLRQSFLSSADRLIALLEQERDYDAAILVAQQQLRHDPLHEATYAQLMRFYALRGERATALRFYHSCAKLLERELGTEPGEATRTIYESLLRSEMKTGPLVSRGTAPPLLGRKVEWRQLQELWRKVTGGSSQIALLSGEAGIGKTRLAEEMEAWANRQGILTVKACCYAALGQLAYAPVTAWLRSDAFQTSLSTLEPIWLTEIARLVPEVLGKHPKLPHPAPMTEGWQRQHFYDALVHAVLHARQPLVLLLDDLQWCDNETLEWLQYLFRFDKARHVLLMGTMRTEEILPAHPLLGLLGALQRDGLVTEITLGPLTTTETGSLAEHVLGRQLESDMIGTLYGETEGNPLFVVEMLRAGTLEHATSPLPPTVQSVLAMRLAQLTPQAREVVNVAAVIGREFSFSVLSRASGEREDDVMRGLDELWQRRIVREQGASTTDSYDFSHDKLRELAYTSMSPTRRHLLHRRIAEALEGMYEHHLERGSGQIAIHYERAGLAEKAIPYYRLAGETALRIYANAEAITAFQHAATLLETDAQSASQRLPRWEDAVAIYVSLGDIFAMTGQQLEAREAYSHALAWIPSPESGTTQVDDSISATDHQRSQSDNRSIWQARILRKTAITWNLASDNPLDTFQVHARQLFQAAERILEQVETKNSLVWGQEWIQLQLDQIFPLRGSVDEMMAIIEKARPVVEEYGSPEQRGQFFQALIARDSKLHRYAGSEQSIMYRRQSLAELQKTGNRNLIGYAHFVLGNGLLFANQFDEAEEQMRAAMKLAEQIGSTPLLIRCLAFLLIILRRRGKLEEARTVIMHTLTIPEAKNIPIVKGHRAWLAWRDGELAEAEMYGKASLEEGQDRQRDNAFRWTGLWPLFGVTLVQEKYPDAIGYVRLLLDPSQQPPPAQLSDLLAAALNAWDSGRLEEVRSLFTQAMPLAEQLGYL